MKRRAFLKAAGFAAGFLGKAISKLACSSREV
jgi:hypothetical protein